MSGPPPAPHALGLGKTTRSNGFSLEEIINDPDTEIKDTESARLFLDQLYMIQGELATPEHISHALFYISQTKGVNNMLCSAIYTAAYLVKDLAVSMLTETTTRAASDKLETSVIAAISPQVVKILSTSENMMKINETAEMLSENITRKLKSLTCTTNSTDSDQLENKVQNLIADMGTIKSTLEDLKNYITTQQPAMLPMPYKDVLASKPSNPNQILLGKHFSPEYAKAHAAIRERQILIDTNALEAVDQINGPSMQLKSVTQLHNNGLLLKLNSQEAAAWIKEPANKATFLAKLGGEVLIKD
ncbi:hypothetical protein M404DRAFT_35971 [Pisolithus tinctorius Marx 270]|uniref:Uncharacterized protein n=1 Tax=Pisolithus tinctorius Marx 270 TaxID=870435 RepID=A0A0C3NCK1_PISTI|nr:hypothetical protein M404DRAFT_35971 [Pisolithus tinctorius Marx 270]